MFKSEQDRILFSKLIPTFSDYISKGPSYQTVTSTFRNPGLNKAVGGVKQSKHQYGEAVDVRLNGLSDEEKNAILDYYNKGGYNSSIHTAGTGPHIHIQTGGRANPVGLNINAGPLNSIESGSNMDLSNKSIDDYSKVLDALGYKKPSTFKSVLEGVQRLGYGLNGALSDNPNESQMYQQMAGNVPNSGDQRKSMLAKLIMAQMSKENTVPPSYQEYQYGMKNPGFMQYLQAKNIDPVKAMASQFFGNMAGMGGAIGNGVNVGGNVLKDLDEATAKQILTEAGGDKDKARQIAQQKGYKF